MSLSLIVAAAIFLGSVLLSQKLMANATSRLDDATKLKIGEVFSKRNVNYSIFVFSFVILSLVALYLWPAYSRLIWLLYAGGFAIYLVVKLILNVRKLTEIGASKDYIRVVKVSFGLFFAGIVGAILVAYVGLLD